MDAVLNQGAPAPIDVQVSGIDLDADERIAQDLARQFRAIPGISDVYIPQDMDYPALQVDVNRARASELGLSPQEVVDNLITPYFERHDRSRLLGGSEERNNYFVTVQYPENQVHSIEDLKAMPLRGAGLKFPTYLNQVADI